MKYRPWGEPEALLLGRQSMERQCRAFHQKRFFTLLWPIQATWEEPGGLQLLCIEMQWNCPLLEILLFRDYRNHHAMHCACRLVAQIKMKHCMLVFVLSMDASAQHITYVILSICLYPVCRPVPAEKDVKKSIELDQKDKGDQISPLQFEN